ncbi:MAG: HAD family hydrolase [Zestosphaera sp.]
MIKGIVFDLDGTLVDTVELHVSTWVDACRELGIGMDREFVRGLVGLSAEDIARRLANDETQALRLARLKRRIYLARVHEVRLYPEVREALERLKREHGLRLAVASSTNVETIEAVLNVKGVREFFDAMVGSDLVSRGKPDPEIFREALSRIDVNPAEAMIVGDTDYDIMPANSLGAISVLMCRGECRGASSRPRYIVEDLEELVRLVKKLNSP